METQIEVIQPEVVNTKEVHPNQVEHSEYANGLRKLADWIEAHPEIALPESQIGIYGFSGKEEFSKIAKAMRVFKKEYNSNMITLVCSFGKIISVKAVEYRNNICERVVVGKKTVMQKKVIQFEEVPVEEEIVEWKCMDASLIGTKDPVPLLNQVNENQEPY